MEIDDSTELISTPDAVLSQSSQDHKLYARLYSLNPKYPHLSFEKTVMTFGRKKTCDVVYSEVEVSALHCRIVRRVDDFGRQIFVVTDLSSNGCFVNGKRVGRNLSVVIEHGGTLSFVNPSIESMSYMSYIFQINSKIYNDQYVEEQDEVFNFYSITDEEIGRGNTGVVKLALDRQNSNTFAVKIMAKEKISGSQRSKEQFYREVTILKKLRHPNVISYVDIFEGKDDMYIILELGKFELFDLIVDKDGFSEDVCRRLFTELLTAVKYLHSQGIVHRDIKPENILLTENLTIKLTDFGLARITENAGLMTTLCGTPQYLAPEIIRLGKKKHKLGGYDKAVDMWSLGVVLFVMIAAEVPFDGNSRHELFSQIESATFNFQSHKFILYSNQAKDMISKLLVVDTSERMTCETALGHPWISSRIMAPPLSPPPSKKRRLPFSELTPQQGSTKRRRIENESN